MSVRGRFGSYDGYCWCRYTKIRNKSISNYYILNLAAADELLLCTVPFYCVSTYTSDWMFGDVVCRLAYLFRESNKYTGILTLVALSVDRCLASYHSTTALRRLHVGIGVCVGIWIVSLAASLPYATNATVATNTTVMSADNATVMLIHGRRSCQLVKELSVQTHRVRTYCQLVLGLAAPLAVIAGANAILLWKLSRRSERRSAVSGRTPSFGPMAMARLVIIVVGVFVVCQLPYHVVEIMSLRIHERWTLDGLRPSDTFRTAFVYIYTAAQLMVYVSSCCNPIIYGIFNHNYRKLTVILRNNNNNNNNNTAVKTQGPLNESARDVGRRIALCSGDDRESSFLFQ